MPARFGPQTFAVARIAAIHPGMGGSSARSGSGMLGGRGSGMAGSSGSGIESLGSEMTGPTPIRASSGCRRPWPRAAQSPGRSRAKRSRRAARLPGSGASGTGSPPSTRRVAAAIGPRALMPGGVMADNPGVDVYARADAGSSPPLRAIDETAVPVFSGEPRQVAGYLVSRMRPHADTLALLTAELSHLAGEGTATDSLCFVLADHTRVTVWP
jgi:hypothetical protein